MTIAELRARADTLVKAGQSPHNPLMEVQKKFSIPAACLVFALIGVALGATHRRTASSPASCSASAVIFVYWGVMLVGQSLAKGHYIGPWLATWLPNLLLGAAGHRRALAPGRAGPPTSRDRAAAIPAASPTRPRRFAPARRWCRGCPT